MSQSIEMITITEAFGTNEEDSSCDSNRVQEESRKCNNSGRNTLNSDASIEIIEGNSSLNQQRLPQRRATKEAFSRATIACTLRKVKQAGKPILGILFFVLFCFLRAVSYVLCSMMYNRNTDPILQPFPMLFMRSAIGIALILI